jgi:hypothetical protein
VEFIIIIVVTAELPYFARVASSAIIKARPYMPSFIALRSIIELRAPSRPVQAFARQSFIAKSALSIASSSTSLIKLGFELVIATIGKAVEGPTSAQGFGVAAAKKRAAVHFLAFRYSY